MSVRECVCVCVGVCEGVCVGVCVRPSDLVRAVTFFSNRIFLNNLAHKYIIMRRCVAYMTHVIYFKVKVTQID